MAKKNTVIVSFRISADTAEKLRAYISINTLNFSGWMYRIIAERLEGHGVIDENGEVLGDWLNPENRKKAAHPRSTEKMEVPTAFLIDRDSLLLQALNNFTAGNCKDGANRSDCLRYWITDELYKAGAFGAKGKTVLSKLKKKAA